MRGRAVLAARRGLRRRARGVTLLIAMLMLVVIGLVSVAIMRSALGSDQAAAGVRAQVQALQYAQAALRWCERQAVQDAGGADSIVLPPATPPRWTVWADWQGPGAAARTLTRSELAGDGPSVSFPAHAPQCMAERQDAPGGGWLVITARGASLDEADDAGGRPAAGARVWVQSFLTPSGRRLGWRQLVTPPAP